jgi:hypothetical protein
MADENEVKKLEATLDLQKLDDVFERYDSTQDPDDLEEILAEFLDSVTGKKVGQRKKRDAQASAAKIG